MLASITPLGERGRHGHWGVTVSAFLIGSGVTGVLIGALAGGAGALLIPASVGAQPRLTALALSVLVALGLDASGAVPGPGRQVNERWLEEYRGWVYGLGYGAQLGAGVLTVVTSAATYVALLAALISGGAGRGAAVVGLYGVLRGLTPLAAARVRSPGQLVALHRALGRSRVSAARGGMLVLAAVLAVSLAGSIG
ncbi:MAG TPA: hypothetical protein VIL82_02015 [Solirubrobacteraceae bacterium]|jgi:hypothetical protein